MRIALKELLTFIILVSSTTIRRTVAAVPQKQSSNHAAREEEQKVPGGDKHRDKAIIVGGGPVGLASAIMLANRGYDVSIFEATTADEINTFNPSSAYLYNINTRGQTFTKVFPKLHKKLVERSVGSMEVQFMIVPGDTSKKIIYPNGMKFDQVSARAACCAGRECCLTCQLYRISLTEAIWLGRTLMHSILFSVMFIGIILYNEA